MYRYKLGLDKSHKFGIEIEFQQANLSKLYSSLIKTDVIVRNIEFIGGNKQNKESDFIGEPSFENDNMPF